MKWTPAARDSYRSEDGRYTVTKVIYVTVTGPHPRWEAWRSRTHEDGLGRLGAWISQDEARQACEVQK